MESVETPPALDQEHADLREVLRLVFEGKRVTDPEPRRRITERADEARRTMLQQHGLTDIAVALIREGRDEDRWTPSMPGSARAVPNETDADTEGTRLTP